jgi:NAD(P)-dependent dehydrogenase (short-subunit alcohol dehydrogenase family)
VLADIDGSAAEAVAQEIVATGGRAQALAMDHTRVDDCHRAVALTLEAFGGLDVLVNNAGVAILGTALDITEADLLRQLLSTWSGPT